MKISEVDNYQGQVFGLLKFTTYIDSLLAGDIYMNNFKRYIDMELESGQKGVGDKLEVSHVYNEMTINMYDHVTNELVMSGNSSTMNFRFDGDEKRPVYCMFAIVGDLLEVVHQDEEYYYTKINLPKEQLDKMINEFGNQMIFVNPNEFLVRATKAFDEKGYSYRADLVKYDDYQVNSSVRLNSYKNQDTDIYFWKDKYFENQYEYRIVLTDQEIDEAFTVNIGDISDISIVFDAAEFFSDRFELRISK